jgi:molecular chaperone DnaK
LDLSLAEFNRLTADLIERSLGPCRRAMQDAKLSNSDIQEVLLVGGSTRIPAVQEAVEKFFGKKPNRSLNPTKWWQLALRFKAQSFPATTRLAMCCYWT